MMRAGKGWAMVAALWAAMAAGAGADVLFGDPIGGRPPQPEDLRVFDDRMRMGARLVFEGSEDLAFEVKKPVHIELQMGFITSADVPAQDVRLRCKVFFVNPRNHISRMARDVICHEGNLGAVAGSWVPMALDLTFRPVATDLNGTSGVRIEVKDELSGAEQYFMPTYNWQGGAE